MTAPRDDAPRGYAAIKALAHTRGCPLPSLLALSKNRDPFFAGTPAQVEKAQWFAALWQTFAYTSRVHLRRIHYQLVSQHDPRKPDGSVYENTEGCWSFLTEASQAARYLGLVSPLDFEDHRNPPARLAVPWEAPPTPALRWEPSWVDWDLPQIPTQLAADLDFSLPVPELDGYDYSLNHQPYHLEIWIEKSTMNDVLLPLARAYGAVLVTSVGFQSITSAIEFVAHRVTQSGKAARILYLSDFDPAGDSMPVALARQIEFWTPMFAPGADIKLTPLGLTRDQVQAYRLPRIPIKDSDARKSGFEGRYGEGAVELDALEALHPGELAALVRTALASYVDTGLAVRCAETWGEGEAQVQSVWRAYASDLDDALTTIHREAATIYARYQDALEQLAARLQDELTPLQERLDALRRDVAEAQASFTPTLPARPDPITAPADESTWLFDSSRDYLTQLAVYKQRRNGAQAEEP